MRRFLGAALLLLALVGVRPSVAGEKAAAAEKVILEAGKNVTATFHPFNVTARIAVKEDSGDEEDAKKKTKIVPYTTKHKYHCLITEYDLDSVVMLFVRGNLEDNAAFRDLLQKIDGAIDRNPGVRLRSFVVFIGDYKDDSVVTDNDKRDEEAKKIQKLADDLMLKQVVLTLASKSDVAKYPLDPAMALTSVLYKTLRIAAVHKTSLDKLDKADGDAVNAIMKDVAAKLKATRVEDPRVSLDLESALWQAIHDNPTDETSWLVLADWLEDQGDPRAELLRVQQELRAETDGPEERRLALEKRVREILATGVRPCAPVQVNSIGMPLALIRPGWFWMGSQEDEAGRYADESPRRRVEITRPFYLGVHQVTQAQYERVMGNNPSHFRAGGQGADRVNGMDTSSFPIDSVSWHDAVAFCAALSKAPAEKKAGRVYRLPTEAEWEYACRAGAASSVPYHFGPTLSPRQANFDGSRPSGGGRRGRNLRRTCAVGSYPPNAFGLYDMHGNVWEWCNDWFDVDYYEVGPVQDPPGPDEGESRILRGGSFYYIASSCRSAIRFGRRPDSQSNLDGFRVAVG